MAYETLIVEIEDYTCLIRLNRPDALNALNTRLMAELASAAQAADRNDKVRCIVVTGRTRPLRPVPTSVRWLRNPFPMSSSTISSGRKLPP